MVVVGSRTDGDEERRFYGGGVEKSTRGGYPRAPEIEER
jgi:hypothetical protein